MPSGLVALLDDVALIARTASASIDDVAVAAGKAGSKTAGVIIDDAAVTPSYVTGLDPSRELPIIWKITRGSLRNKLIFLLPAALLLSEFAPFLIIPILMLGGSYLSFEGAEKVIEKLSGKSHGAEEVIAASPEELEKRQVSGAVRTDLILSAEIMAITLNELTASGLVESLPMRAAALALVAVAVTFVVYGAVGLIVKLDDIGLAMARRGGKTASFGRGLVAFVPKLLKTLSIVGTAAMLWVGGSIMLHGFHELHVLDFLYQWNEAAAAAVSGGNPVLSWVMHTLGAALVGLVWGTILALVVTRLFGHGAAHDAAAVAGPDERAEARDHQH